MTKDRKQIVFEYADFETYSPSTDPKFWYGMVRLKDKHYRLETLEDMVTWITTPHVSKERAIVFHNAKYDVGIIVYHLVYELGLYKLNARKGTPNTIYTSSQKVEIFGENVETPICSIIDSRPIIEGSIGNWGDKLGLPKGDTPLTDVWRPVTRLEWDYVKRDIDILYQASQIRKLETHVANGLFTTSSITQFEMKSLGYKNLNMNKPHISGFKTRNGVKAEKVLPLPKTLTETVNNRLNEYVEQYSVYDIETKLKVLTVSSEERAQYERKLRAFWTKVYNDHYSDFKAMQKTANRMFKKGEYPTDFMELPRPDLPDDMTEPDGYKIIVKYNDYKQMDAVNFNIVGAMRGGASYVNPKYQGKTVKNVGVMDVNSLYPFILMQYDIPSVYKGYTDGLDVNKGKYYVAQIKRLRATLKDGKHPSLKRSTKLVSNKEHYSREIDWVGKKSKYKRSYGKWDTCLCSVDIDILYRDYHVHEIEYGRVYYFETDKNQLRMIREHIKYWKRKKETAKDPHDRQYAKMMLNTIWGRWGMYEKDVEESGAKVDVGDKDTNLVSAIFTTAYARYYLYTMINYFKDDFIYCDTDSVHFRFNEVVKDEDDLRRKLAHAIDPSRFGAWDFEAHARRGRYLKPKTYCYEKWSDKKKSHYTLKVVTAGSSDIGITELEQFDYGYTFETKKSFKDEYGRYLILKTKSSLG